MSNSLKSIQFHVYSDDEIRKLASVQVTNCSTYDRRYPKSNGLNDIRMGINDPNLICPTCGKSNDCSNHYGFIELEKPIIRVGFINIILQLLKCVCWGCSKPKFYSSLSPYKNFTFPIEIQKKCLDIRGILSQYKDPKEILKHVSEYCKKKTICPWTEDNCNLNGESCGLPQCTFTKVNKIFIKRIFNEKAEEFLEKNELFILKNERIFPDDIFTIFESIPLEVLELLGFLPNVSHPKNFIGKTLLVPPPNIRPANISGDTQQRCENDITLLYQNVIRANLDLKENLEKFLKKREEIIDSNNYPKQVQDSWDKVQILCASIINQNFKNMETFSGVPALFQNNAPKRILKDIKSRLCGKRGRLRANLSGKRVDHAARTVIGPDSTHDIFELGVPSKIMNTLTFPEKVSSLNINLLKKKVLIGANKDNGALGIEKKRGEIIYLHHLPKESKQKISENLEIGDCVERHLCEGDWVVFNRQPTLHKASIMAFQCYRVKGYQFKLSLACTRAFNADFDGDEMNLHALQDYGSIAEAMVLMAVPQQIVTPQNNQVLISLVQDGLLGAFKLTTSSLKLSHSKALQLSMNIHYDPNSLEYLDPPISLKKTFSPTLSKQPVLHDSYYTGKDLLTLLFPSTFTFSLDGIEIQKGKFLCGVLKKKFVGTGGALIKAMWQSYGPWATAKFISDLQRLCVDWLQHDTECISIKDCLISEEENIKRNEIIGDALKKTKEIQDLKSGILSDVREFRQTKILQDTRRAIGSMILEKMNERKGAISTLVQCGSKGNEMNISQISGIVGQQSVGGLRIPFTLGPIGARTLACFSPNDNSPSSRGFISNSYVKGLSPSEFFYHQQAGREGVVATAVQTADAGYNQRRMIKNQESEVVAYDYTIRGSSNNVLQFKYGGDGFDASRLTRIYLDTYLNDTYEIQNLHEYEKICIQELKNVLVEKNKYNLSSGKDSQFFVSLPCNLKNILASCEKKKQLYNEEYISDKVLKKFFKDLFLVQEIQHNTHNTHNTHNDSEKENDLIHILQEKKTIQDYLKNLSTPTFDDTFYITRLVCTLFLFDKQCVDGISKQNIEKCLEKCIKECRLGCIHPGEGAGPIGSSCIGEPSTQMTLNVFHHAGIAEKNVTLMGLPRFKQLIDSCDSKETSNMFLNTVTETENTSIFTEIKLIEIIEHYEVIKIDENKHIYDAAKNTYSHAEILGRLCLLNIMNSKCILELLKDISKQESTILHSYHPKALLIFNKVLKLCKLSTMKNIEIKGFSSHAFFYTIRKDQLISKNIKFLCICNFIREFLGSLAEVTNSLECDSDWIILIRPIGFPSQIKLSSNEMSEKMSNFCEILMHSIIEDCIVNGIEGIKRCIRQKGVHAQTDGSNMIDIIKHPSCDSLSVTSNNVMEVYSLLGVEAAGLIMQEEFQRVLSFDGGYVDEKHTWLLVDTMTHSGSINPLNRFKMEEMGGSILQRASFEQTLEVFESGAGFGKEDFLSGSTERMVVGQPVRVGTGCFSVFTLENYNQNENQNEYEEMKEEMNNDTIECDEMYEERYYIKKHCKNDSWKDLKSKDNWKDNRKDSKDILNNFEEKRKNNIKLKKGKEYEKKYENKNILEKTSKSLLEFKKNNKVKELDLELNSITTFFKEICILASQKKLAKISLYKKNIIKENNKYMFLKEKWNNYCKKTCLYIKVTYKNVKYQKIKSKIYHKENNLESFNKNYNLIEYHAKDTIHIEKNEHIIKLENWLDLTQGEQDDSVIAEKTSLIYEEEYILPKFPEFVFILQKKWKGENFQSLESLREEQCVYQLKILFSCPWEIQKKFTVENISELFVQAYFLFFL